MDGGLGMALDRPVPRCSLGPLRLLPSGAARRVGMRVPGLKGLDAAEVGRRAIRSFSEHGMAKQAGALAYRGLFALLPFAALVVALVSLLQEASTLFEWLVEQAGTALPEDLRGPVARVIAQEWEQAGEVLFFGSVVALWSVSVGARWLVESLNVIYEVEEMRPAWNRAVLSFVFAPVLAILVIAATGLVLLGPQAINWIAGWAGLHVTSVALWALLRLPVALLLISLVVSAVYHFAPDTRDRPFRSVIPGAIFAVTVWAIGSLCFYLYLVNFSHYSVIYGSLGAAIALIFYLYLSAIALLLGAEVNVAIFRNVVKHGAGER